MSIWLPSKLGRDCQQNALFVVYDMEFIGPVNQFNKCRIWEIAALVLPQTRIGDKGPQIKKEWARFHSVCHPVPIDQAIPPHVTNGKYHLVTKGFLKKSNAISKRHCLEHFLQFLLTNAMKCQKTSVILISHGNMKSDKVVLENECGRHGIHLPGNILFYDTLHLFRRTFRKLNTYDLLNVHRQLKKGKNVKQTHRAVDDVCLLCDILIHTYPEKIELDGAAYCAYSTPLQNLPGIGYCGEKRLLLAYGIKNIEDLVMRAVTVKATNPEALTCMLNAHLAVPRIACQRISMELIDSVLKLCEKQSTIIMNFK